MTSPGHPPQSPPRLPPAPPLSGMTCDPTVSGRDADFLVPVGNSLTSYLWREDSADDRMLLSYSPAYNLLESEMVSYRLPWRLFDGDLNTPFCTPAEGSPGVYARIAVKLRPSSSYGSRMVYVGELDARYAQPNRLESLVPFQVGVAAGRSGSIQLACTGGERVDPATSTSNTYYVSTCQTSAAHPWIVVQDLVVGKHVCASELYVCDDNRPSPPPPPPPTSPPSTPSSPPSPPMNWNNLTGQAGYMSGVLGIKSFTDGVLNYRRKTVVHSSIRWVNLADNYSQHEPDASCYTDPPTRFPNIFYHPARVQNPKRYIFYLWGGGWCGDYNNCKTRHESTDNRMVNNLGEYNHLGDHQFEGGLLSDRCSNDQEGNPFFCDWGLFEVEYCDGSSFFSQRGKRNVQGAIHIAIAQLLQNHGPGFDGQVLLAGASAGGTGVMLNAKYLRQEIKSLLPHASVKLLVLSSPFWDSPHESGKPSFEEVVYRHHITQENMTEIGCNEEVNGGQVAHCYKTHVVWPLLTTEAGFEHDDVLHVFSDKDSWVNKQDWGDPENRTRMRFEADQLNIKPVDSGKYPNVLYYTGVSHGYETMHVTTNNREPAYLFRTDEGVGGMQLLNTADPSRLGLPLEEYLFRFVMDLLYVECVPYESADYDALSVLQVGPPAYPFNLVLTATNLTAVVEPHASCSPPPPPSPPALPSPRRPPSPPALPPRIPPAPPLATGSSQCIPAVDGRASYTLTPVGDENTDADWVGEGVHLYYSPPRVYENSLLIPSTLFDGNYATFSCTKPPNRNMHHRYAINVSTVGRKMVYVGEVAEHTKHLTPFRVGVAASKDSNITTLCRGGEYVKPEDAKLSTNYVSFCQTSEALPWIVIEDAVYGKPICISELCAPNSNRRLHVDRFPLGHSSTHSTPARSVSPGTSATRSTIHRCIRLHQTLRGHHPPSLLRPHRITPRRHRPRPLPPRRPRRHRRPSPRLRTGAHIA